MQGRNKTNSKNNNNIIIRKLIRPKNENNKDGGSLISLKWYNGLISSSFWNFTVEESPDSNEDIRITLSGPKLWAACDFMNKLFPLQ